MATVTELNEQIAELEKQRDDVAKAEFKEFATEIFLENPELKNFAFGLNANEYNDEGLYEGINGVALDIDEDEPVSSYRDKDGYPWEQEGLEKLIGDKLSALGDDTLISAFGANYDLVIVNHERVYLEDVNY